MLVLGGELRVYHLQGGRMDIYFGLTGRRRRRI